jgi:magnesium-transporting ATPase (P-type)
VELSKVDQVDPLYVVSAESLVQVKLTSRLVLQKYHVRSHAFLGESSEAFQKRMLIMQYSWFNDYSGQIAFEGWSMSYYNVIFTILPPLVIGIFDQFVSARMLDRYPQLYQLGQQNYFFTPHTFFYWVGNAFYHSVVSTFYHSNVSS